MLYIKQLLSDITKYRETSLGVWVTSGSDMSHTAKVSPVSDNMDIDSHQGGRISLSDVSMATSGSDELDVTLQTLRTYYDAIIADDSATVSHFLSVSDDQERCRLLNYPFRYPTVAMGMRDITEDQHYFEVRYPVVLAAVVGSLNVLDLFLQHGVDFTVEDDGGNVLHALCFEGFKFPNKENHTVATFNLLLKRLPHDVMKDLLLTESKLGSRPIELAGVLGCYQLIDAMFNTKGVYLAKVCTCTGTAGVIH